MAARCAECGGEGRFFDQEGESVDCEHCSGQGWFGVDPHQPVMAVPGTVAKIAMLTVRYASGVPLWNPADGVNHRRAPGLIESSAVDETEVMRRTASIARNLSRDGENVPASLAP